ncbi:hypothetical protein NST02_04965 [Robertmurraya sp. FSL W8-0741]|uniref:hypothetical protein n=1 Tax=Robertmurraya sp. FSL W8-0741 TaxID=2954629 RepID=UPI0030F7AF0F
MATHTPNYDLIKPAPDDFYNVADQNENMDKIDSALKGVSDDLTSQQADYMYQVPNIVGTQIRINKLSNTNRLFFRLDDNLTGNITISTDGGATSKPLQDIDGSQITQLDKGFVEVVADANFFILRNRGLGGADKQALIDIVNEAERNESDVKSNLINVINEKVGSTLLPNAPWIEIQNAIGGMTNKRWATGAVMASTGNNAITVTGLDFKPSIVIAKAKIVPTSVYDKYNDVSLHADLTVYGASHPASFCTNIIGNVSSPSNMFTPYDDGFYIRVGDLKEYVWIAFE